MRGREDKQARMVLTTLSPDDKVPQDHPLRRIKAVAELALLGLEPIFDQMYSQVGRPSISPERLLKGKLLIHLYSIRSERQLCEQLDYNLLFRWFLDMDIEAPTFDPTTFTKNRDRLMAHDAGKRFFEEVVRTAELASLLRSDHFTLDGTLIDACASLKSLRRKDEAPEDRTPPDDPGNPTVDFRGQKRGSDTHVSGTDPEAKLARKGKGFEARLRFAQHVLMENRHGRASGADPPRAPWASAMARATARLLKALTVLRWCQVSDRPLPTDPNQRRSHTRSVAQPCVISACCGEVPKMSGQGLAIACCRVTAWALSCRARYP